jgi:Cof subfamily protein (haloacid dehalogenase superfamily)
MSHWFATDLDGTLLRSDGSVSARSRAALAAAEGAGALVVLVTGRPPRWMAPVAAATGHRGLAVCANGAIVYDLATETIVRDRPIEPAVAAEVVAALRASLPEVTFAVERGLDFGREPAYRPPKSAASDVVVEAVEALVAAPVSKLLARHPTMGADEMLALVRKVVGETATATHSSAAGLIEISAAGVSKAVALAELADEHGRGASDAVAFGDMPNDLPLLAWAGHAVAVANAHADVLAAADEVTASNDDDGVALVVERLLA